MIQELTKVQGDGLSLPQNARDEYGIEDLDSIFSSPEKPYPRQHGQYGNRTLTSEDMQLAYSMQSASGEQANSSDCDNLGSAPEPTEVLSTCRVTL